jgi:hypothetical protein
MAGQLQHNEVFGEHIWFNLRVMFESACGAVQKFLLFVDNGEALFANCVTAVEVARCFLLRVIEIVAHWAFHLCLTCLKI